MTEPRIIAHRCGGALAPENTLAGLVVAARMGCHGVEFDAMLAADDVPILMHDESLDRTSTGSGAVAAHRVVQLSHLDAGYRHHRAFAGERIPTLTAALARCAELGLWANVEIKPTAGREEDTGRLVAAAVAASPLADRALLSSFSGVALTAARRAAPSLPRAMLFEHLPADWQEQVRDHAAIRVHFAAAAATSGPCEALSAVGMPFACYTVNTRAEADRLFALGAVAVFTDRPDLWSPREM